MEYNKIKRGLEKSAGIVGVTVSSIEIFTVFIIMLWCLSVNPNNANMAPIPSIVGTTAFVLLIPMGIMIANLVFNAMVIKSPVRADGTVKQRIGIRICILIFSFLDGQWVTLGLIIAVICLKDFAQKTGTETANYVTKSTVYDAKKVFELKSEMQIEKEALIELKNWKDSGLLTEEEEYNAKRKQILKID